MLRDLKFWEFLVKALALIGVFFAIWQYYNDLHIEQKSMLREKSAQLAAKYGSAVYDNVTKIRLSLFPYTAQYGEMVFARNGDILTEREKNILFLGAFIKGLNEEKPDPLLDELIFVLDYYDEIFACINQKLCDDQYLLQYICSKGVEFDNLTHSFITTYRTRYGANSAGKGLERILESCNAQR